MIVIWEDALAGCTIARAARRWRLRIADAALEISLPT